MSSELKVTLASRLEEIGRLAGIVETFGASRGVGDDVVYAFNLSLDEIVTNVISYAFPDAREHQIAVTLRLSDGIMMAEIADTGRPFNPLDIPAPNLDAPIEARGIGGLGMHIVREMMDEIEYRREGERNVLTLKKRT